MRRGYTRDQYLGRIRKVRERIPEISLSTDLIVGFPGETDDDFGETLSLVREVEYDSAYIFAYSPRPGTPAALMQDDVDGPTKRARLARLQALQREIQAARYRRWVGRVVEVLVDGPSSRGDGRMAGRTPQNIPVNFHGDPDLVGRFVPIRVEEAGSHSLKGSLMSPLTSGRGQNINRDMDPDRTGPARGPFGGPRRGGAST
jgi:tRNA-2-methylthio-N6-dimethylallyladenosine synthase